MSPVKKSPFFFATLVLHKNVFKQWVARVGDDTYSCPNALSESFSGALVVLPFVEIDSKLCKVLELGYYSLYSCSQLTDVILPNTIETLTSSDKNKGKAKLNRFISKIEL